MVQIIVLVFKLIRDLIEDYLIKSVNQALREIEVQLRLSLDRSVCWRVSAAGFEVDVRRLRLLLTL